MVGWYPVNLLPWYLLIAVNSAIKKLQPMFQEVFALNSTSSPTFPSYLRPDSNGVVQIVWRFSFISAHEYSGFHSYHYFRQLTTLQILLTICIP